jgi:hypothetical protein
VARLSASRKLLIIVFFYFLIIRALRLQTTTTAITTAKLITFVSKILVLKPKPWPEKIKPIQNPKKSPIQVKLFDVLYIF